MVKVMKLDIILTKYYLFQHILKTLIYSRSKKIHTVKILSIFTLYMRSLSLRKLSLQRYLILIYYNFCLKTLWFTNIQIYLKAFR